MESVSPRRGVLISPPGVGTWGPQGRGRFGVGVRDGMGGSGNFGWFLVEFGVGVGVRRIPL